MPGTGLSTSVVGLLLSPPAMPGVASAAFVRPSLRRLGDSGVRTFVVAADPDAGPTVDGVPIAFPDPDPDLVVILDVGSPADRPRRAGPHPEPDEVEASLTSANARLRPHRVHFVRWSPRGQTSSAVARLREALGDLRRRGTIVGDIEEFEAGRAAPAGSGTDRSLLSGPLSLIDRRMVARMEDRAGANTTGLFATDPWAGGRLDGSAMFPSAAERRPGSPPVPLRDLQRELEPALRLAPLTSDGTHSLAEQSLRYVLHWPWVCCVLVPVPPPERIDALVRAASAPPLTADEVARIDRPDR